MQPEIADCRRQRLAAFLENFRLGTNLLTALKTLINIKGGYQAAKFGAAPYLQEAHPLAGNLTACEPTVRADYRSYR